MSELVYQVPRRLDQIGSLLDLKIPELDLSCFDTCKIDFRHCTFGEPLPMMLLGRELRDLVKKNPDKRFSCISQNSDFRGYADHIGFFRYCGFLRGRQLGEAAGSRNYIPITFFNLDELKSAAGDRPYAELVEQKADELAAVLVGRAQHGVFAAIQYSLREIMRNCFEHSMGESMLLFGQYWPARSMAEIVIFDTGIGIANSFAENLNIAKDEGSSFLKYALQPGVTSVSEYERSLQDANWRNSGFGLFVTSKFCRERGVFRIISGETGLTANRNGFVEHKWRFSGTCVQMKIDTSNMTSAEARILEIVDEGERMIGSGGRNGSASKGSRSISGRVAC